MKYLALLLFPAGLCFAQDFVTGQAARLVIGQSTFTRQEPGLSAGVLGAASGLAYANNTLFVVDANRVGAAPQNHRVLIYRNLNNGQLPQPSSELPSPPERRCQVCGGVADFVLGQPSFDKNEIALSQAGMRTPTAVATDGRIVAVADTDNNRVLIWNSIPTASGQPADVVVGQANFTSGGANAGSGAQPNARGFRGPQGVWIQGGKLYVADTQNHRVMIWNSIPTSNNQEANVVLGQANFNTVVEPDLTKLEFNAKANNMLNPVSVTSDGTRLFVTDLGYNRVLVWNTIPTSNQAPADFVLGQPDVDSTETVRAIANNSQFLCAATGKDSEGKDTFPRRCAATLDFPRFALSDGRRLFVADGGNNRILVWNSMPTRSGQPADVVLGQIDEFSSDDGTGSRISASDALRTPMSLAWDGTNLYASDPYDHRVMVFTLGDATIIRTAIRNAASREVFAVASITVSGNIKENDEGTIKIGDIEYKYKVVKDDTVRKVIDGLVAAINKDAGDPNVLARPNYGFNAVLLTARKPGEQGNGTLLSTAVSTGAELVLTASTGSLSGGQDAARIAPGTLITITGSGFSDTSETAPETGSRLPTTLAGVQVYADGQRLPLVSVSPTQIVAQIPFEVADTSSISLYVRRTSGAGTRVTNAIGVPIVPTNPGLFAAEGTDPRPAVALHGSSSAQGVISIDGSIKAGDTATVTIEDRDYAYSVKAEDTLETVRNNLIDLINQDPKVFAFPATQYTRIRLQARTPGSDGNGINFSARQNEGATIIVTALNTTLCCANEAGAPITEDNPAQPGEVIIVYATGLGVLRGSGTIETGQRYDGTSGLILNTPIDDAIAGGRTANVLYAGPAKDQVGVYEVHILLNNDIPTNPLTQLTIAQDIFVSNIVTFPVVNPKPAE